MSEVIRGRNDTESTETRQTRSMTRRNDIQQNATITEMPNEISEGGLSGGNEHQTATTDNCAGTRFAI